LHRIDYNRKIRNKNLTKKHASITVMCLCIDNKLVDKRNECGDNKTRKLTTATNFEGSKSFSASPVNGTFVNALTSAIAPRHKRTANISVETVFGMPKLQPKKHFFCRLRSAARLHSSQLLCTIDIVCQRVCVVTTNTHTHTRARVHAQHSLLFLVICFYLNNVTQQLFLQNTTTDFNIFYLSINIQLLYFSIILHF
jgi:hypothetical protein